MSEDALPGTVAAPATAELVVKRSRFVARIAPVGSVAEADAEIAAVRRAHWNARHHCTALIVGDDAQTQRSSDDGEPAGTAGAPMLDVLRQHRVTDVVAVVSRYFGGVLLGTGGLVRAYSGALRAALDAATTVRRALRTEATVEVPHQDAGRLHGVIAEWCSHAGAVLAGVDYAETARFTVLVAPGDLDALDAALASASSGRFAARPGATRIVDLKD